MNIEEKKINQHNELCLRMDGAWYLAATDKPVREGVAYLYPYLPDLSGHDFGRVNPFRALIPARPEDGVPEPYDAEGGTSDLDVIRLVTEFRKEKTHVGRE